MNNLRSHGAQTAIEYIILLTMVMVVVLLSFHPERGLLIKAKDRAEEFYNHIVKNAVGTNADRVIGKNGPFF